MPPAKSAQEALDRIGTILEQVEDEFSGIEKREPPPQPKEFDGRMYPPKGDMIQSLPNGLVIARARKHLIEIEKDGTISIIFRETGALVFFQQGTGKDS